MLFRLFILSFVLLCNQSFAEKKELNTEKSVLTWVGEKVAGKHDGVIKLKSGYVEIEEGEITGGEFVFDMNTIKNNDIESEKYRKKLEDHLKSDEFFNIQQYPESKFVIKNVKNGKIPNNESLIIGELTIKDKTEVVQFPARIVQNENVVQGIASTSIDRTKFDVMYNSKKRFDPAKLGDKLIYDEIQIGIDVQTLG